MVMTGSDAGLIGLQNVREECFIYATYEMNINIYIEKMWHIKNYQNPSKKQDQVKPGKTRQEKTVSRLKCFEKYCRYPEGI